MAQKKSRSIIDDTPVLQLTSGQTVVAICALMIGALCCFMLGIVVQKLQDGYLQGENTAEEERSAASSLPEAPPSPTPAKENSSIREAQEKTPAASKPKPAPVPTDAASTKKATSGQTGEGRQTTPRRPVLPPLGSGGQTTRTERPAPRPPIAAKEAQAVEKPAPPAAPVGEPRAEKPAQSSAKKEDTPKPSTEKPPEKSGPPEVTGAQTVTGDGMMTPEEPSEKPEGVAPSTPAPSAEERVVRAAPTEGYSVQVAAIPLKDEAKKDEVLGQLVKAGGEKVQGKIHTSRSGSHIKFYVGSFTEKAAASAACKELRTVKGFEESWVPPQKIKWETP